MKSTKRMKGRRRDGVLSKPSCPSWWNSRRAALRSHREIAGDATDRDCTGLGSIAVDCAQLRQKFPNTRFGITMKSTKRMKGRRRDGVLSKPSCSSCPSWCNRRRAALQSHREIAVDGTDRNCTGLRSIAVDYAQLRLFFRMVTRKISSDPCPKTRRCRSGRRPARALLSSDRSAVSGSCSAAPRPWRARYYRAAPCSAVPLPVASRPRRPVPLEPCAVKKSSRLPL